MSRPINIAFYVHHHGSGHIMRTLAIAKALQHSNITLIGSRLTDYAGIIPPAYNVINLPMDTPENTDTNFRPSDPEGIHYAPLNIEGLRKRIALMTDFFAETFPLLLVIDVSVEVAMLAAIAGVPFIVIKQHGYRKDLPHLHAYHNAIGILAPYPEIMKDNDLPWVLKKTFFAGGISRFELQHDVSSPDKKLIAIITGKGGTSITTALIEHIARSCPEWHFQIMGGLTSSTNKQENVTYLGNIEDPKHILANCTIVIGNAGHNTVMELAALNKRFIAIPEQRPFDEQSIKAGILKQLNLAYIINPESLFKVNWNELFQYTSKQNPDWTSIASDNAATEAANYLIQTYHELFKNSAML
ncbi:glycosyltransferase [Pedobacter sp. Leaf176]|uniref:glycosyltransferase n=1 Tax=Pedobacter sp. Leaf176 TaxID=1736286 RepID=UPI0009EAA71B|nr:glycosyltransferase [Pedobacter sp. Leaf176]